MTASHVPETATSPLEDDGGLSLAAKRKIIGLIVGVLAAVLVYYLMPSVVPAAIQPTKEGATLFTAHGLRFTAAIAVLMGVWWMTEAIPLAATALVPLVAFPAFGVQKFATTAAPYASGTVFLFMGGFFLALALQRWNLHRRIALVIVNVVGVSPRRLVLGFMVATGFLSMWVSNTATAVMMLPIGLSVISLVYPNADWKQKLKSNFGKSLVLGIAYAASIASLSTPIGTPPNTFLRGYLHDNHNITINFLQWMLFAAPMAWAFLVIGWLVMVRIVFKPEIDELPGGRELVRNEMKALGKMSRGERLVGMVFILAALSWIVLPTAFPKAGISDELIAMAIALILFITPVRPRDGIQLLDWQTAKDIPWDVLLLFGGGLSLSGAFTNNGLSKWIGEVSKGLGGLPIILILVIITLMVVFLTEMTSNTATAAAFVPIMGGVAVGLGYDAMVLVVPVALAATCAFMLPVATPPNAIAYGSGYVKIGEMVKAGIWLNLIGVVLIAVTMLTLGQWVLGISFAAG